MALRMRGLVGLVVLAALAATHAGADEPAVPAERSPSQVAAAQAGDGGGSGVLTLPRPRPMEAGAPQSEQCRWLGTRIISLLSRDDAMTAKHFNPFYDQFGCPGPHLSAAFGCVVGDGGPGEGEDLASRVDACWSDPAEPIVPNALSGDVVPTENNQMDNTQETPADGGT